MSALSKIFKDVFTEDDNETADLLPIMGFAATATYLGLCIYMVVVKSVPFNGTDFGLGYAAIQTAWATAFKLKLDAQKKPDAATTPTTQS